MLVVGGSLLLFALRAHALKGEGQYDLFSREVFLLVNNIILVCATGVVLVGTLYPILFDVLGWGKISVGEPFFNTAFAPIALVTIFFTAVGPLLNWKRHNMALLKKTMAQALVISVALGGLAVWLFDRGWNWTVFISLSLCVWVVWITFQELWKKVRTAKAGVIAGFKRLSLSYRGMVIAHMGLVICIVGVTMTTNYDVERDVRMAAGDEVDIGPYHFVFDGVEDIKGPNYFSTRGLVSVSKNGDYVGLLTPEKRRYFVRQDIMTEAAIDAGFSRDLYVALGEPLDDGSWAVRIYFKPFMRWVWGGGVIMALGGFIAMSDRRYRIKIKNKASALGKSLTGSAA